MEHIDPNIDKGYHKNIPTYLPTSSNIIIVDKKTIVKAIYCTSSQLMHLKALTNRYYSLCLLLYTTSVSDQVVEVDIQPLCCVSHRRPGWLCS